MSKEVRIFKGVKYIGGMTKPELEKKLKQVEKTKDKNCKYHSRVLRQWINSFEK